MNLYATVKATAKHAAKEYEEKLARTEIKVFIDRDDTFVCLADDYFGISRNYQVTTPSDAVNMFLREHGYYLIKTTRVF